MFGKMGDAGRESLAELAAQIIQNGENLNFVQITRSHFSATATTLILSALSASPSAHKIAKFLCTESANMIEDEACQALADFLAVAENMESFSFKSDGERQLSYDIEYASEEGKQGKVTIKDEKSGEVFEKETSIIEKAPPSD